jgi:NAD(P)-dependent dehydrogenase (short-subunit alcohol dehydrogenase family)
MPRVALVSGCSSGIGRAIAHSLARAGWSVYAGGRSVSDRDALAEAGCTAVALDVCDEQQCRNAVDQAQSEKGCIDALVNNAGFGLHGAVEDVPLADARAQFETNFFSVARLCQLALPAMRARRSGHIINMSSMGGRITFPGGAFYHASKHALEAFSDALRFETSGFGVRVVLIEPGPVRSNFGKTGISTLKTEGLDPAYDALRHSIRSGLKSTYEGVGSELSSSPEEIAAVCLRALDTPDPKPRYVVGSMAETLIEQRHREGDTAWDRFLEGLYPLPGTGDSEPSG